MRPPVLLVIGLLTGWLSAAPASAQKKAAEPEPRKP